MDDKKLRKISKRELLEILLSQSKKIEELEIELKKAQDEVESKKIKIEEAGSIAEAALKLNKIFEIAQETANQYLNNIKELEEEKKLELENIKKKNEKKEKALTKRRTSKISIKKRYNSKAKDDQEEKKIKKQKVVNNASKQ